MAASLSRPDPSSPASVADADFSTTRRGFNQDEVRAFLTSVAAELSRMQERERELDAELRDVRAGTTPPELDEETVASLLGEETVRVLQAARESASEIKARAEESAARILREANEAAKRARHEAEVESARRRQDAASSAEAEIALAKQQGREMVNEARAYRERVLADLERRTTLARNQIEELLHGRDRLLQVFERARLVAVDVTSELQAVDSPDELVNLTPTTGPVPLMVPNMPRPDDASDVQAAHDEADKDSEQSATDDLAADDTVDDTEPVDTVDEFDADVEDDLVSVVEAAETIEPDETTPDETTPDDSANVVELFRGRHVDEDAPASDLDVDDAGEHDEDRPDVGGIFARLRDEVEVHDEADPASDTAVDTAADDTSIIDETATDEDSEVAIETSSAFGRRDETLTPLVVSGARLLKRVLADEQNGVLDALRGKRSVTALDDLLPDLDGHVADYDEALADELVDAAVAGAAELGDVTIATRTRLDPDALGEARRLLRTGLIAPLRDRLERAIADGDGDNEAIAKTIRSVYREWKTQHIDDQLDDVFRFAHGGGIVVAADGAPLVWSIDPAEPACADCEDNSLAGPVAAGEAYPTGHTSAPAHPGCRCLTLPTAR